MSAIIIIIFILGYLGIAMEHTIRVNKAAIALITGVLCWTVFIVFSEDKEIVLEGLAHHIGEMSGVLFFLLGAMTIVELMDAHDGFDMITSRIKQNGQRKLMWVIGFLTFFLSAILDNLTTTIVIISLLRKLIRDDKTRLFFAGIVVIAANAGGAWSPIGDVTTTMLWIGNQISAGEIMLKLILPSLVCLLVPVVYLSFRLKGNIERPVTDTDKSSKPPLSSLDKSIVFYSGISILIMVPVFKTLTHLPPYMGILIGLGLLWLITELLHGNREEAYHKNFSVAHALRKIDTPSILFFLGILLSIGALQSIGILTELAKGLTSFFNNEELIVISIGVLSAIVDNVPLVAASQAMYDLSFYPTDHSFWIFLAYCAGTGGSMLIIGSAAGVAAMGLEKISFTWYLKKISLLAMLGYLGGIVVYLIQVRLF